VTIRVLSSAEKELTEAIEYYEQESTDAAIRFIDIFESTLELIRVHPKRYPIYGKGIRAKVLEVFPFSVLYHVDDDEVVVISLHHHKRSLEHLE